MHIDRQKGRLEVLAGGVLAGKTHELVRRLREAEITPGSNGRVAAFAPKTPGRPDAGHLISRDDAKFPCRFVSDSEALYGLALRGEATVVGIDEAHLFDGDLVEICERLANRGIRVIVAGLDLDANRAPYETTMHLLALGELVTKLNAVCTVCGSLASRSRRLLNVEHFTQSGAQYVPLCRQCFERVRQTNA